ncbi:MAG: hypothetical protein AAGC67_00860 [Myxococcota bacterium]
MQKSAAEDPFDALWAPRSLRAAADWVADRLPEGCRAETADEADDRSAAPSRPSILPKNYLLEFVAGTFGPASSGRGLMDHLESEENVRRIVTRTNLGIMAAQDLEENSRRKLEDVQVTRAVKCKHTIQRVVDHLERSVNRVEDRPHVIRELFSLDDSNLGQRIASALSESHFLERLADEVALIPEMRLAVLRAAETQATFDDIERRYRTELACYLPEYDVDVDGRRRAMTDDKALKIINRIFDAFAPRMILIGHSQGGLVALRAMQLGMKQVRVKDKRRFLHSPRSGRVHRYSPVALAIGLGAPFDGIVRSPSLEEGKEGGALAAATLPGYVKQFMPGVGQMLHGSAFLRAMRRAFIPFDCTAISIANPKDGLVALDGTRLPVGDFQNMHNVEVRSTGRFDLADIAPEFARPALGTWPMTLLRSAFNEQARFEGLREHCSFLVDLHENWDVDKGEIVRKIFDGEGAETLFDEMMFEVNFDGLREQLMANLLYRLRTAKPEERRALAWMAPRLRDMIDEEQLPFLNSLDKRAALALLYIEPQ